ncbi:MAG TPA: hypothetical protein VMR23_10105, partial [Candidatus Limnocylindria bacterium]|nr:hypothetical protein [Candidatus Limnocylindria bacterium]
MRDDVADDDVVGLLAGDHGAGGPRGARDGERRAQALPEMAGNEIAVRADVEPSRRHLVELAPFLAVGHEHPHQVAAVLEPHGSVHDHALGAPDAETRTQKGDAQRRRPGHRAHRSATRA